ncbi:MAG: hypothetical protein OXQ93_08135 [Gemmatimonadota bacterium]|nr:hypothetical protein [Gemmatimonadota bacterium]
MFVDGPPQVRPGAALPATADRTTSSVMPIVDIIMGTAATAAILEVFPDDVEGVGSFHIAMLAYPVAHFGSSIQGFRRTGACKRFLVTHRGPRAGVAGGAASGIAAGDSLRESDNR